MIQKFLGKYVNETFLIRKKAQALLYFGIIISSLMLMLLVVCALVSR